MQDHALGLRRLHINTYKKMQQPSVLQNLGIIWAYKILRALSSIAF